MTLIVYRRNVLKYRDTIFRSYRSSLLFTSPCFLCWQGNYWTVHQALQVFGRFRKLTLRLRDMMMHITCCSEWRAAKGLAEPRRMCTTSTCGLPACVCPHRQRCCCFFLVTSQFLQNAARLILPILPTLSKKHLYQVYTYYLTRII